MMIYFWFRETDPDRPGGPWWAEYFDRYEPQPGEMLPLRLYARPFLMSLKPFLHAYAIDPNGTRAHLTGYGDTAPPWGIEVVRLVKAGIAISS